MTEFNYDDPIAITEDIYWIGVTTCNQNPANQQSAQVSTGIKYN